MKRTFIKKEWQEEFEEKYSPAINSVGGRTGYYLLHEVAGHPEYLEVVEHLESHNWGSGIGTETISEDEMEEMEAGGYILP